MEGNKIFINSIKINHVRNIVDFEIPLGETERRHLILTGKNGSGKTSVLLELKKFLESVFRGYYQNYSAQKTNLENFAKKSIDLVGKIPENHDQLIQAKQRVASISKWLERFGGVEVGFAGAQVVSEEAQKGKFLISHFDAKRMTNLSIPQGINKVNLKHKYAPSEHANTAFIQYIVNLKAERSFARDDGDEDEVERIDRWFDSFENRLRDIFESPELQLIFDRKNYNFKLNVSGREPFGLTELSDGHSAIISIITELILRMEGIDSGNYNLQGIVLIDEIETHLHVDLQKKILPFLSDFFPNLQFIVTTHSPFVLQSISNSVVCDLQNRVVVEDLSGYSYDALIESYFQSDKYSGLLKEKIDRYEYLSKSKIDSEDEREEYLILRKYLENIPKYYAAELDVKLQQIALNKLSDQ